MKALLILLFSLCLGQTAFADCPSAYIDHFPNTATISTRPMIMLDGYGQAQKILQSLNKNYPIYLLNEEGHKVKLRVKETWMGERGITQVILNTDEALQIGEKYFLKIDHLTDRQERLLKQMNFEKEEYEYISWVVDRVYSKALPQWTSVPKLIDQEVIQFGCGPAVNSTFSVGVNQISTLIKTEREDLSTGEKVTYYLTHREGKVHVGHGMCGGAFDYDKNSNYRIRFSLMNADGQGDGFWTDWVEFKSPYDVPEPELTIPKE